MATRDVYQEVAEFIHERGGWVASVPGSPVLKFECPLQSDLPAMLRQAGLKPLHVGMGTRLNPAAMVETVAEAGARRRAVAYAGFVHVEIFDVKLVAVSVKNHVLYP